MKALKMKKKEWVAVLVIIMVSISIIWAAYLYYNLPTGSTGPRFPIIDFEEIPHEDYIIYNVTNIASYPDKSDRDIYGEENYEYRIYEKSRYDDHYLEGSLSSIRNITDFPIIWRDNDGDNMISLGDEFIVYPDKISEEGEYRFALVNVETNTVILGGHI